MGSEAQANGNSSASATGESNAESKGKGVARDGPDQEDKRQADGDSVVSRLGNSAAGLARSVIQGAPSVHEVASVSASGKADAHASSSRLDARAETSSTAAASHSSSFRSEQTDAHVAAEEAAFSDFLDNTSVFVPTERTELEKAWNAASSSSTYGSRRDAGGLSVSEQQDSDGAEVVRLLSQLDGQIPDYEAQLTLSEQELRGLRRALFEDESSAQVSASDWNNMLNFIPDFLRGQDGAASESSLMNLGLADTAEAGQQWLSEWNRVLTSYNDEVWGDLGDLVQQARTEVQTLRHSRKDQVLDPGALRRLQTVLTRVRARL